mmetsp:Transcript_65716/g.154639  ORF Transcript_65716/g.154639 Transcript_65716/m.154639 type:complete len:374 (-) Transcript_65716:113-1234(-)
MQAQAFRQRHSNFRKRSTQLAHGHVAIPVYVQEFENLLQVLRVLITCPPGQRCQGSLLQQIQRLKLGHRINDPLHNVRTGQCYCHLQPLMPQSICDGTPALRLLAQQLHQNRLACLGDLLPARALKAHGLFADLVQELFFGLPMKRILSRKDDEHYHTSTPGVAPLIILYRRSDQLRSNAVWSTSCSRNLGPGPKRAAQTEINQLYVADLPLLHGFRKHDVLRLQITEYETGLMQIGQSGECLSHYLGCLWLCKPLLDTQAFQQSATGTNVHNQVYVSTILVALVGFTNVRVVQLAEDVELVFHCFGIRDLLFWNRLYGHMRCHRNAFCSNVPGSIDNPKAATSKLFKQFIVVLQLALFHLCQQGPVKGLQTI